MPVSRKRKKLPKKKVGRILSATTKNKRPGSPIASFADLQEEAARALQSVSVKDLDSIGLASFYILYAPSDVLNQCVMASGSLWLARQVLGAESEIAPAVLQIPWANEQWGKPQPELNPDGTLNGHVVLVTDTGILIDVTAGQFASLNARRNGLPIIGRDAEIWNYVCAPEALKDPSRRCKAVIMSSPTEPLVSYDIYSPMWVSKIVAEFLSQGGNKLSTYVHNFINQFVWIVANTILVGARAHEVALIPNPHFQSLVRAAVGTPRPAALNF